MEIWRYLERRMDSEINKMPYNLTERQMNKLVTKAVKKVGSEVAKRFGITKPTMKELVNVYFYCDFAFPDFPNEAYIEMLKGEEGEIIRIGEVNENGEVVLYN